MHEIETRLSIALGPRVGEIDDRTLVAPFDRRMRRVEKAAKVFRQPVIAPRFTTLFIHSLLHDAPVAFRADDESVQVEIETILYGGAVDLRDQATRIRERRGVEAGAFAERRQLQRRLS